MIRTMTYQSMQGHLRTTLSLRSRLEGHHHPLVEKYPRLSQGQAGLFVVHQQYDGLRGDGPSIQGATMTPPALKGILGA